jgi:membrane fusion protein (multidrug efflux system)
MQRFKYAILVVVIIVGAFLLSSFMSNLNKKDLRNKKPVKAKSENVITVKNKIQTETIETSGRMYAFNKVDIFAEVPGVLLPNSVKFKAGTKYKKGEALININPDVFKNTVLAQKSTLMNTITLMLSDFKIDFPDAYPKWEEYVNNFDLTKPLKPLPEVRSKKEKYYVSSHNVFNLFYSIKSMEATLSKYTIPAPFDGIVIQSNITPGTLVRNGQKLGEFIDPTLFEMAVPVKIEDISKIQTGMKVELKLLNSAKTFSGKIVRINKTIDKQTQTIDVYIQSNNKGILDGQFMEAEIKVKSKQKLARLPLSAIGKEGKAVVKNDGKEEFVKVNVVEKYPTYYLVSGLKDGTKIVIKSEPM